MQGLEKLNKSFLEFLEEKGSRSKWSSSKFSNVFLEGFSFFLEQILGFEPLVTLY
jgi:hypothetical protein